jgi:hypothetical protein
MFPVCASSFFGVGYLLLFRSTKYIYYIEELKRIWNDSVLAWPKYNSGISLEGLRKTTETSVSIASVLAKIRTEHFLNTGQDPYC